MLDGIFSPVKKATRPLSEIQIKRGVLNCTIPSAASDTAATSSAFLPVDPVILSGEQSTTVLYCSNSGTATASIIGKTHHKLQAPATTVKIVMSIVGQSLISTAKVVDIDYMSSY